VDGAPGSCGADLAWLDGLRGRFIVFEGPDGSGKSTQLRRLSRLLAARGVPAIEVREPGGTAAGEAIRATLLDHRQAGMDLRCEMLLYMASRAQLVAERIRPALDAGRVVLADRFTASTLAYQGAAGGLPEQEIRAVASVVTQGARPDLVLVFDVDGATAARRLSPLLDRMEAKGAAFHARVRRAYLDMVEREPATHARIDASGDEDAVFASLLGVLRGRLAAAG